MTGHTARSWRSSRTAAGTATRGAGGQLGGAHPAPASRGGAALRRTGDRFRLFWAALATALTVRAARTGLPFSLTWWSFTFPVGTVVTGLSGLAARAGSRSAEVLAMALYALLLVAAWLVVAVRTLRDFRLLTR